MNVLKLAGDVKDPSSLISKIFGFFTFQGQPKKYDKGFQQQIFQKHYGETTDEIINMQSDDTVSLQKMKGLQKEFVDVNEQTHKQDVKEALLGLQSKVNYKGQNYKTDYQKKYTEIFNKYEGDRKNADKYLKEQEELIDDNLKQDSTYKNQTTESKFLMIDSYIKNKRSREQLNSKKSTQFAHYYFGNDGLENTKRIAKSVVAVGTVSQAVAQPVVISKNLYEGQQKDREKRAERKQSIMSMTNFSMYKPQSYRQRIINIMNQGMR